MQEIFNFDVKVNVILNGLKHYMTFTINNNLPFIDSMQFRNSSLDALVKNLSGNDFKYLTQKFSGDLLELARHLTKHLFLFKNRCFVIGSCFTKVY